MIRLRQLNLELFGQFTGKVFDFGPRRKVELSDFHVIYGPNEAGKTTTMEGFLRLLYGFPHREPYDFLHQRKNLRISGILDVAGTETAFTRLPREPSLRDAHGQELPNSVLQSHLAGLSEEDYRNLLCLDDLTIERGGEEITRAKGDIGRLLFSAAAGISELSDVLDQVRQEADGLFRKRASSTRFAELKKDYAELVKSIQGADISPSQYRSLIEAADKARREEVEVSKRRKDLYATQAKLQARIKALPLLVDIAFIEKKLQDFSAWPTQIDVSSEDLMRMLQEQFSTNGKINELSKNLERLRSSLSTIVRHPEHLVLTQELQELKVLEGRYVTAEQDLITRREQLKSICEDVASAARDLGVPAGVESKNFLLSADTLEKLELARKKMQDAEITLKLQRDEVTDLNEKIEKADRYLHELGVDSPVSGNLTEIFNRFDLDKLSTRHAAALELLNKASSNRMAAFYAITIKGQSFDFLPISPLTLKEAEALQVDLNKVNQNYENLAKDLENTKTEVVKSSARIAQIKTREGLIDDEAVHRIRNIRDDLWTTHREKLNEQTAIVFEEAMKHLDSSMDQRLSQASDIGKLRQQEQDLAVLKANIGRIQDQITSVNQARDAILDRFAVAAQRSGIVNQITPEVFVDWLRKIDVAGHADLEFRRVQDEHDETFQKAALVVDILSEHIRLDTPQFEDIVAVAKTNFETERAYKEKLRNAKKDLEELAQEHAKRDDKLSHLQSEAENARRCWHELISSKLANCLDASFLEASLKPLYDLRAFETQREDLERRIVAMEMDKIQFAEKVKTLTNRFDVKTTISPLSDFSSLENLEKLAIEAENKFRDLEEQIEQHELRLADAHEDLNKIDLKVSSFSRVFPESVNTTSLEALRQAVITVENINKDRESLAKLELSLKKILEQDSLEAARAVLEGVSEAKLEAELNEVNSDLENIEQHYTTVIEARARTEQELRSIRGDADVALLVERKATLELEMKETALRYLELVLGHHLAEAAIRRYRDEHRSAMMRATEIAFTELTNGAYAKLQTRPLGASEALLALDVNGVAKQAQDMSKGTRFQLYLALRAAAYEQLADQGTVLPFFCDDIFETFDEQRTSAACHLMKRIGLRGQAIYFTHHKHVVDIAREVCGDNVNIHDFRT